VEKVLR